MVEGRVDPSDQTHKDAALIARVAEAERRLAIYGRRVIALRQGVKLAPGEASKGLLRPRELEMTSMSALGDHVEVLFEKLRAFERALLAVEAGAPRPATKNLPVVSAQPAQEATGATPNLPAVASDGAVDPEERKRSLKREKMRRYRERKRAQP